MSVDRAAVFSSGSRDRGLPISQLFLGQPPAVQVLTEGYEKDGSGSGLLLGSEFSLSPQKPHVLLLSPRDGIWGWFGCSGKNVLERRKQLRYWLEICRTVFRARIWESKQFDGNRDSQRKDGIQMTPVASL